MPEAPYPFAVGQRVGYSWTDRSPDAGLTEGMRSRELTEKYVLDVLAAVKRHYLVDERKVFLMGFSQGAGMTFSVGMDHPDLFRGLIPIGGWCDPGEHTKASVARAAKHANFLVCHSPSDRMVPFGIRRDSDALEWVADLVQGLKKSQAVVEIAELLELAPADVQDTLTFYRFF